MLSPQTDEDRLARYFAQLKREIDWISDVELEVALSRSCKYRKLLEERNNEHGGEKEAGPLCSYSCQEGKNCSGQRGKDA